MPQVTINAALSVALVQAGTLAFAYPAGYNKGDFTTYNAELVTGSNDRFTTENADFTVSLGNTSATITFKAATSIPAGTDVCLGLNAAGLIPFKNQEGSKVLLKDAVEKKVLRVNLGNPVALDDDGIANDLSATTTAQAYTLTNFVTAFKNNLGYLDVPRNITLTGTSGSDHVVTITGLDLYGDVIVEQITLSGTTKIQGKKAFAKVTNIAAAAGASGDTFDAGWGDIFGLPIFIKRWNQIYAQYVDDELIATNSKVRVDFAPAIVAANAGTSQFYPSPVYGYVSKASVAICAAFTTGGAVIPKIATVAVVGLSVAVGTGAAGTVYTDTATDEFGATGEIGKDASIEIAGDSAFDSVGNYAGWVEITPGGKVVVGDELVPTATTGDVRGTWQPPTALISDASRTYILDVVIADTDYIGMNNYDG
ncbi:MAG: hypothetical protein V4721_00410 [Bacteroidota bacterium]